MDYEDSGSSPGSAHASPPLCGVCNHHHAEHVKCPVCGHRGKGKTYQLLAAGPVSRGLNFRAFDHRTPEKVRNGYWAISEIIRKRIFCEELKFSEADEFDADDRSCRHIIVQVGDAPIGCARWRLKVAGHDPQLGDHSVAVVDRIGLLSKYRNRGYGRKCLEYVIADVLAMERELRISVEGITVPAPNGTLLAAKLENAGFQQRGEILHRGVQHAQMLLDPKSFAAGLSAI